MTKKKNPDMEKRMEHFSKEIEHLGERFGNKMEKKGDEWDSWFHNTLGVIGPLVSSIIAIICVAIGIRVLAFVNFGLDSAILTDLHGFLLDNIGLFFLLFLFFSYVSYISRVSRAGFRTIKPFTTALGIVIAIWIGIQALIVVNIHAQIDLFTTIANLLGTLLVWIFVLALLVGYLVLFFEGEENRQRRRVTVSEKRKKTNVRRLYRSGEERVLGGVCGGIANYLEIDPVIIRLFWIIATLITLGTGILAYIIAWIIIPRNPSHRWED